VAIGLANGALGQWLKGPRVLVTLAATGFLNALSVYLAFGWPNGFAPAGLMSFMSPAPGRTAPAVLIIGPLLLIALALLATPLPRRWLRGLGQTIEPPAARRAAPLIHGFAALLAAGVGIMLAGYGGQAPISAAEPFTLPSLLAIETAGLTVGRRGGNPALLILAVPMVTLIDMLMLGTGWSYAARVIAMGALLLAAVTAHGLHRRLRRCAGNADGIK
jgi:ribose/xylose/arabinose/galactoside ABC-type transport system permease subunit